MKRDKIIIIMSEKEKNDFEQVCDELGFSQSQLALMLLYSLVALYNHRNNFVLIELEYPNYQVSEVRNKRVQVPCPQSLKIKVEEIARNLGSSQSQISLFALHSFVTNYKKTGISMLRELLSADYRK